MAAVSAAQPSPLRPSPRRHHRPRLPTISLSMKDGTKTTTPTELKIEAVPVPQPKTGSDKLRFDRLQPAEDELLYRNKREFGRFVAREAQIDEEYWTAAWLRAESHWEDKPNLRHADSFKRQFAEREFIALKRRCNSQLADKSTCIIAMKRKETNVKQTVLSSIVGTLDLSIRYRICTGMFPEETVNSPVFSSTYNTDHPKFGYVANLCVSKYARRQGIASNMLQLAVEAAKSFGVDRVFVHVRKDNTGARKLYDNLGFQCTFNTVWFLGTLVVTKAYRGLWMPSRCLVVGEATSGVLGCLFRGEIMLLAEASKADKIVALERSSHKVSMRSTLEAIGVSWLVDMATVLLDVPMVQVTSFCGIAGLMEPSWIRWCTMMNFI